MVALTRIVYHLYIILECTDCMADVDVVVGQIVRNGPVRREHTALMADTFVARMKKVQQDFNLMGEGAPAVQALGETQVIRGSGG
jgi:hypothetical protein